MGHQIQSEAKPAAREQPAVDAKTRILDTAERLFAQRGFERTSIKRLAGEAGVNQAAVNYYFGSKAALIEKVIERRMQPLNRQRQERLEAVRQGAARRGCRPRVENVMRAFIEPSCTLNKSGGERNYFLARGGRAFLEPDSIIRLLFVRQFRSSFQLLVETLRQALPDLPEDVLLCRLQYAIGATTHCMGLCSSRSPFDDFSMPESPPDAIIDSLLTFITRGLCAPCPRPKAGA